MDKGHEALNRFLLLGTIERIKTKQNGSRVIYLRASHRPDKMLTGAVSSPTFFTGVLILRISGSAIAYAKVPESTFVPGTEVFVEGSIQGVLHKIQGEDYFTVELWVHRLRRLRGPGSPDAAQSDGEDTLTTESQEQEAVVVEGESVDVT